MKEYIGCTIKCDEMGFQLSQPDMIKKLQYQFRAVVKSMQVYKMPMVAGHNLMHPKPEEKLLSLEKQTKHCSGVGNIALFGKALSP